MAVLVTNTKAFPTTKLNFNGNIVTITFGNSLAISAGMYNAVYLGSKTLFIGGVANNINLGITTNYTFGNVLSTSYGASWNINNSNNTSYDIITRFGVTQNVFGGGVSDLTYLARVSENGGLYGIAALVVVAYMATIGLTILGMKYPIFTMVGKDEDGYATGVEVDNSTNVRIAQCFEGAGVVALAITAFLFAQKMWSMKDFNPVANMRLDTAGINCEVYQIPDGAQPILPPGIERPNAPPLTSTTGPKAALYMRPSAGSEIKGFYPGNPLRSTYSKSNTLPEIELLATSGPGPTPFSQIFMEPTSISIGTGLQNVPDAVMIAGGVAVNITASTLARSIGCGPCVSLSLDAAEGPMVSIYNSLGGTNGISMDLDPTNPVTSVYRAIGTTALAVGAVGAENSLNIALDSIKLSAPLGSIAIDATGKTIIKAGALPVPVASFDPTGVKLVFGASTMTLDPTSGCFITAPQILVN